MAKTLKKETMKSIKRIIVEHGGYTDFTKHKLVKSDEFKHLLERCNKFEKKNMDEILNFIYDEKTYDEAMLILNGLDENEIEGYTNLVGNNEEDTNMSKKDKEKNVKKIIIETPDDDKVKTSNDEKIKAEEGQDVSVITDMKTVFKGVFDEDMILEIVSKAFKKLDAKTIKEIGTDPFKYADVMKNFIMKSVDDLLDDIADFEKSAKEEKPKTEVIRVSALNDFAKVLNGFFA